MHDTVEALCFADNLAIAMEVPLPKLIGDHRDGMRTLSLIFVGQKAATEDRVDADGVKVIGRDNTASGALGAIPDAERNAGNLADEGRFAERAVRSRSWQWGQESGVPPASPRNVPPMATSRS